MKKLWLAAIAIAPFSASQTGAQTAVVAPMTVDEVAVGPVGTLVVTGVVQGDSAPSTRTISWTYVQTAAEVAARFEACHRSLLLALNKPGQYMVRAGPNVCSLVLVTP